MATQTRTPISDLLVTGTWTPYPASPTTRFDKVDDGADSKDDDTTYIIGIANNDLIDFGFSPFTIPAGAVVSEVRVYAYAKDATSGTNSANGRVSCGATPTGYNHGTTVDPHGTVYTLYSWAWATNPHHAGYAWTPDDVNGIGTYGLKRFGYRCPDAAPDVRFTSVWIECTYTALTTKVGSDSGAGTDSHTSSSPTVVRGAGDSGVGGDLSAKPNTVQIRSDAGVVSEAKVLAATDYASDNATVSEISFLLQSKAGSDGGIVIEGGWLQAARGATDVATGGESRSLQTSRTRLDAATSDEESNLGVVVSRSDSATGVETRSLTTAQTGTDSAVGSEGRGLASATGALDYGAGAELSALTTVQNRFDTGIATGQSTIVVQIDTWDSGLVAEASDLSTGGLTKHGYDNAAANDTSSLDVVRTQADDGVAVEVVQLFVDVEAGDYASASEVASVSHGFWLYGYDDGAVTETSQLAAQRLRSDSAVGFEIASLFVFPLPPPPLVPEATYGLDGGGSYGLDGGGSYGLGSV